MTFAASRRTVDREGVDSFISRVCVDKAAYDTIAHAYRAKDATIRKTGARVRAFICGVTPYRCPYCGKVHLGHAR